MINKQKLSTLNISLEVRSKLKQAEIAYISKTGNKGTFIEFCNMVMTAGIDKMKEGD
jgi:hypothetical protein